MKVIWTEDENNDIYIGKIVDPWACCNMTLNIYDEDDVLVYVIDGSCCQCGLFCRLPCGPCEKVEFPIYEPAKGGGERRRVGQIDKVWGGCFKEMLTDASKYVCRFPVEADGKKRALILCAALFLDYRFFEEKQNNQ